MKKIFKVLVLFLLIAFIAIQFISPEKNDTPPGTNHLFSHTELPGEIRTILQNACLDCHSNQTNYLWYHKIAPVSWMINNHIVEGKNELNLSEWEQLDLIDKIGLLDKICREVETGKMPIKAYTLMHKNAKLTEEQIIELCLWTEKISDDLISANFK